MTTFSFIVSIFLLKTSLSNIVIIILTTIWISCLIESVPQFQQILCMFFRSHTIRQGCEFETLFTIEKSLAFVLRECQNNSSLESLSRDRSPKNLLNRFVKTRNVKYRKPARNDYSKWRKSIGIFFCWGTSESEYLNPEYLLSAQTFCILLKIVVLFEQTMIGEDCTQCSATEY